MLNHAPQSSSQPVSILGYPVAALTLAQALAAFTSLTQVPGETLPAQHWVTANPEILMLAQESPSFSALLRQADRLLPDGIGVVVAMRLHGVPVHRLPGIELAEACLAHCAQQRLPVALIGASPDTHAAMLAAVKQRWPSLNVSFQHHGYFADGPEADSLAHRCALTRPALVLVALGMPRQDAWIAQYRHLFHNSLLMGVGGSFDVWSGQKQRAPKVFCALGMEWVWRVASEPWRLKRIFPTLPLFLWRTVCERVLLNNG